MTYDKQSLPDTLDLIPVSCDLWGFQFEKKWQLNFDGTFRVRGHRAAFVRPTYRSAM